MIELSHAGRLDDPIVLAAFEGWNDAAESASQALRHLARHWEARGLGGLEPDEYYDFQVNRPTIRVREGVPNVSWPTSHLGVARLPTGRDVILLHGLEPNMRWRGFCAELIEALDQLGARQVITLAALLGDAPHTRPVPVHGTTSDPALQQRWSLHAPQYEGPTGIVGVFHDACARAGMAAASFWAAVPYYVAQPPCPKATLALLRRVEDVLDTAVPLGDLVADARAWQDGVDELAAEDQEVADYVRSLEEAKDTVELPEASGDAIAKEFERYLRRRDDGPPGEHGGGRGPTRS